MLAKRYLFCCVVLFILQLFAVEPVWGEVRRLSTSEGLSQSYVTNLVIDKKGYLWLATDAGLNKYDGYQVVQVQEPSGELDEAGIHRLYQDPKGNIWISSLFSGLHRYDPASSKFRQYLFKPNNEEQALAETVSSLLSLGDDYIWLGRGKDVARMNVESGEITSVFALPNPNERSFVRTLFHHRGYLYIGTSEGAYVMQLASGKTRAINYLPAPATSIYQSNVKSFAVDDAGWLLVGTVYGLYKVDISDNEALFADPNGQFKNALVLAERNIWKIIPKPGFLRLATDKGLFDFEPQSGKLRKQDAIKQSGYTLTDPAIIDVEEDPYGAMWVATKNDGAFYLPSGEFAFRNFNSENIGGEGLSHHVVWAVEFFQGTLWLGTDNGLTELDPESGESKVYFRDYGQDEYTENFGIAAIFPYQGRLWLNTTLGLYRFDPQTKTLEKVVSSDGKFAEYLAGRLFGGTLLNDGRLFIVNPDAGMFYFNLDSGKITPLGGDFKRYDPFLVEGFKPPLPDSPEKPLFYNSSGQLFRVDVAAERLELIYEVPKDKSSWAISLHSYVIDHNNILWLSLSNFGLVGLDAKTFQLRYVNDFDKYNLGTLLYAMTLDDAGMIWLSSHKGIWRFNPDNMHFQQYTTEQGLDTNEFNMPAHTRLPDGRIAYGSVTGLTLFDPKKNRPTHPLIKQVNITSVELMSRQLKIPAMTPFRSIELEHDDIGLEVAFSAMAFNFQDRIVFEYQLSGEQKTYTRNSNRVIFPKLSPGSYRLKVWAKDPFTGDYTAPAQLDILVAYPLWRSPLAILLYVLVFVASVAGWMYRRNRVQRILLTAHRETRESEARLKLALEGSHSGVWDWQASSSNIYQPRLKSELGYENEQTSLDEYLAKIHPQERQKFRVEWLEFLSTEKGYFDCTYRLRHASGHWRWYKDFGKVVSWLDGMPEKVAGTYTNMTRELVFEENARLYGAAFEQTRDWVLILDHKFRIRATNQSLRDTFNYSHADKSSRSLTFGLSRDSRLNYLRLLAGLGVGEQYQGEETVRTADGKRVPVLLKASAVASGENKFVNYIIVMTDISAQRGAHVRQREQAGYDDLSGLPNRTLMLDRCEHALSLARLHDSRLALLLINIKGYSAINQRYGDQVADQVLMELTRRISSVMGETDSLARLNGDEFLLLMEEARSTEQIARLCGQIQRAVDVPLEFTDFDLKIGVYMGVALYPLDGNALPELLKAADIALFQARRNPKVNFQFFKPEFNLHLMRRRQMVKDLVRACEEFEFGNEYEEVRAADGHVVALDVRPLWLRNDGKIDVREFLDVAAEAKVLPEIGRQTLSSALLELKAWRRVNHELYLVLPLYGGALSCDDFMPTLEKELARHKLPPEVLTFALDENQWSRQMLDSDTLTTLRKRGCRVLLDNFSCHGLTLQELAKMPLDGLRMAAQQGGERDVAAAVTEAVVAMAHSLKLQLYCRDVDDRDTRNQLKAAGIDYWQGLLSGGVMDGDAIAERLEGPKARREDPVG